MRSIITVLFVLFIGSVAQAHRLPAKAKTNVAPARVGADFRNISPKGTIKLVRVRRSRNARVKRELFFGVRRKGWAKWA